MTDTVTAFKFGDKIAIRIPKRFGFKPGQKFKSRKINVDSFELIPVN